MNALAIQIMEDHQDEIFENGLEVKFLFCLCIMSNVSFAVVVAYGTWCWLLYVFSFLLLHAVCCMLFSCY